MLYGRRRDLVEMLGVMVVAAGLIAVSLLLSNMFVR
jgi:hypothetical protein